MTWQPLIKESSAHPPMLTGEYREHESDEHYVFEFRSLDRKVSFLSDPFKWAKNRLETNEGYTCEYGELGTGGLIVKIPNEKVKLTTQFGRRKRELISIMNWVYSKHPLRVDVEETKTLDDGSKDREYDTKW